MRQELTGRKVAGIFVAGFSIVIAVNLVMASFATRGFSGTVVDNSYVASQEFNGWLERARQQDRLGWSAQLRRSGDALSIKAANVPQGAEITAHIRRPLGQVDNRVLTFAPTGKDEFLSREALPAGRWIVRVKISSGAQEWVSEEELG